VAQEYNSHAIALANQAVDGTHMVERMDREVAEEIQTRNLMNSSNSDSWVARPKNEARLGSRKAGSFSTFADFRVELGLQANESSLSRVGGIKNLRYELRISRMNIPPCIWSISNCK
jgi:hypothetical protein